jgi:hypothetical protein
MCNRKKRREPMRGECKRRAIKGRQVRQDKIKHDLQVKHHTRTKIHGMGMRLPIEAREVRHVQERHEKSTKLRGVDWDRQCKVKRCKFLSRHEHYWGP